MNPLDLPPILERMILASERVSGLSFSVGQPPQIEVNGRLSAVYPLGIQRLTPYQTEIIALSLLHGQPEATQNLVRNGAAHLSFTLSARHRFRTHIFRHSGVFSVVMRVIPPEIPTLDSLKLPWQIKEISALTEGLVLISGPSYAGKSSTLAAIINDINEKNAFHILTVEDPIEYQHHHRKSTVIQREVGTDVPDFRTALYDALRYKPKVIMLSEVRDLATAEMALRAAETGHLVLAGMTNTGVARTISYFVKLFLPAEEPTIRNRLAQCFRYIMSQQLVTTDDSTCVPLVEVLTSTPQSRACVEQSETARELLEIMKANGDRGMQDFAMARAELVRQGHLPAAKEEATTA